MAKVLFVCPGPIDLWSSSRLRGLWPARALKEHAKHETFVVNIEDGIIPDADITVWIKRVIPSYLDRPGAHIWDLCDPVYWFQPAESREIVGKFDAVVCSNKALAEDFAQWAEFSAHVIPDRLDLSHFPQRRQHDSNGPIRFIWFGAGQNRISLFSALTNLERLRANGVQFSLTICDDRPNQPWGFSEAFPIQYVGWRLDQENEILAAHDIALLPPYPGPWGKVKSNNKTLTAGACGLAVTDGQDYEELYSLATSERARRRSADIYSFVVQDRYNIGRSGREWAELINAYYVTEPDYTAISDAVYSERFGGVHFEPSGGER